MSSRNAIPTISIRLRDRAASDPTPYQADATFQDGRDYHAIGATPWEALAELALFWGGRAVRTGPRPVGDLSPEGAGKN